MLNDGYRTLRDPVKRANIYWRRGLSIAITLKGCAARMLEEVSSST